MGYPVVTSQEISVYNTPRTSVHSRFSRWTNLSATAEVTAKTVFEIFDNIFSQMTQEETLPILMAGNCKEYTYEEAYELIIELYGPRLNTLFVPEIFVLNTLKRKFSPRRNIDASLSIVVARLLSAGYIKICLSTEEGRQEYKKALQSLPKTRIKWDVFFSSRIVEGKTVFDAVFYNKQKYIFKFFDHGFCWPQHTRQYDILRNAGWAWISTQEICGQYVAYYLLKLS